MALSSQAPSSETALAWTSEPIVESLRQTRPWVFFLSIVGFIVAAIIALLGFSQATLSFFRPTPQKAGETLGGAVVTSLMGVLYFFPSLYLLRFAGRIRDLTHSHRVADLEAALAAQKSFWRFCGIVAALMLSLYALIIIGAMAVGLFAALRV